MWSASTKFFYSVARKFRMLNWKKRCSAFGTSDYKKSVTIEQIYVINLDRESHRWVDMELELRQMRDNRGKRLLDITERFSAIDSKEFFEDPQCDLDINPVYSLADQLFVEPQPLTLPSKMDLNSPIKMSRPEVAVARSHIKIWRQIVMSQNQYVLILEDDVWFHLDFANKLEKAWAEITANSDAESKFDILYLSYEEVKHGAPKTFISKNVFRPLRGIWHLSGYVLSREGAQKLLLNLPCRGPIDLWINHKFENLNVKALKRSVISQRRDICSTNSYSILPILTKIGAINSESESLFQTRLYFYPIFAFGPSNSGLSSLAMALSMLGYRCCSDLNTLPLLEVDKVLSGRDEAIFNSYVNIGSLANKVVPLRNTYPNAKFIFTITEYETLDYADTKTLIDLKGADLVILNKFAKNKWQIICEHLRCAPPACSFPDLPDLGMRQIHQSHQEVKSDYIKYKKDISPWIIEQKHIWNGIYIRPQVFDYKMSTERVRICDHFKFINEKLWLLRDDTFTDNLGLFRTLNINLLPGKGASLTIEKENLGVRQYSAASISSKNQYVYGKFEAIIKASNAPGIITGFFLHRNSPRQEIDIEIAGNRTDRLLLNVFFNPGCEGAKFDYGYRGAPHYVDLGFDASQDYHHYAIEWTPYKISWFVDYRLVHTRYEWDPTPIPQLPMTLHANIWPTRSIELAGKLNAKKLPTTSFIKSITFEANQIETTL